MAPEPSSGAGDERRDWLRLTLLPGIGGETQRSLLRAFGTPDAIFSATPAQLITAVGEAMTRRLLDGLAADQLEATLSVSLAWLGEPGHHLLTLADATYPRALLDSADPPTVLYARGQVDLLQRPALAIVGSRNATAQGARDAEAFARALGDAGLTIVSGLALGIDAAAHRGALATAASTVAVIGTGADRIYPARNAELARQIATDGVIVSEFPLGTPALAGNFPRRNRIIAGLALGTLVVEAAPQSGSLITARLAAEAGREVFAIPGSIHAPQSKGCHQLIRQGAKLVETARDVLDELRWEQGQKDRQASLVGLEETATSAGTSAAGLSKADEQVLTLLAQGPLELDMLTQLSGLTAGELLAILLTHELAGRVAPLPGGLYQRLH